MELSVTKKCAVSCVCLDQDSVGVSYCPELERGERLAQCVRNTRRGKVTAHFAAPGTIPDAWGSISRLRTLLLANNHLTGAAATPARMACKRECALNTLIGLVLVCTCHTSICSSQDEEYAWRECTLLPHSNSVHAI